MIISEAEKKIPGSDRKNPALAVIKERYALTKAGSTKQVYHISLDLKNAPLQFSVGDSLGIFPKNDPIHVEDLITAVRVDGDESILDPRSGDTITLRDFLSNKANLSRIPSSFLKLYHEQALAQGKASPLGHLLLPENKTQFSEFVNAHETLDIVRAYSETDIPIQDLCNQFSALLPRFYSVASSPLPIPNEVHLTVALTVYPFRDQRRYGVASHFLCHLANEDDTPIPVYVQKAHHFTLPKDDNIPIIMIGPGTGVAPFRAFLQERIHRQANGKNWLFFGDRHRTTDYYYQDFWESLSSNGLLTLSTGFSRDQEHKIYVQHMMQEHAQELFAWLESGAHLYVCGDAQRMAKDVEAMLHAIVQEQGSMDPEAAKAYVKSLRAQKRYVADVY